jgi:hypothetical protein
MGAYHNALREEGTREDLLRALEKAWAENERLRKRWAHSHRLLNDLWSMTDPEDIPDATQADVVAELDCADGSCPLTREDRLQRRYDTLREATRPFSRWRPIKRRNEYGGSIMPTTLDTRTVVKVIREKLEDAVFEHKLDVLADVYDILVLKDTNMVILPYKNYFIVDGDV